MSERIWRKDAPPHVGWWNASVDRMEEVWRWWNGRYWSAPAGEHDVESEILRAASSPTVFAPDEIEWTDYYPANARVPRIAP